MKGRIKQSNKVGRKVMKWRRRKKNARGKMQQRGRKGSGEEGNELKGSE